MNSFLNLLTNNNLDISDIYISLGSEVSKSINNDCIAIFYIDTTNFESKIEYISDLEKTDDKYKLFEEAIESGIIAELLNSNNLVYDEKNKIVFAQINSRRGLLGIMMISSTDNITNLNDYSDLLNLCFIAGNQIQLLLYENELSDFDKKINQIVAVRTREFINQKIEINEKVEQLKSSLLMTLPHEVRTPINQILGLTDFLMKSIDDVDKEELAEVLDDIYSSTQRLRRMFENYLYLSNLSIISYSIEELDEFRQQKVFYADLVIEETASGIAFNLNKPESIKFNLQEGNIKISQEHLTKIIYELVDNSFKFGDEKIEIYISSEIQDNYYKIIIKDTGSGIPTEKLFMLDAYIQFDRLKKEQQGSGLGLAIVKKIVNIYEGTISFKSEPEKFTEVTIKLQLVK